MGEVPETALLREASYRAKEVEVEDEGPVPGELILILSEVACHGLPSGGLVTRAKDGVAGAGKAVGDLKDRAADLPQIVQKVSTRFAASGLIHNPGRLMKKPRILTKKPGRSPQPPLLPDKLLDKSFSASPTSTARYCLLFSAGGQSIKSKYKNSTNPEWDSSFPLPWETGTATLQIEVYGASLIPGVVDKLLGQYTFMQPAGLSIGDVNADLQDPTKTGQTSSPRMRAGRISFTWEVHTVSNVDRVDVGADGHTLQRKSTHAGPMLAKVKGLAKMQGKAIPKDCRVTCADSPDAKPTGCLRILRASVVGLQTSAGRKPDPYLCVRLHSSLGVEVVHTTAVTSDSNPTWDDANLTLGVWEPGSTLQVVVCNLNIANDDQLGSFVMTLSSTDFKTTVTSFLDTPKGHRKSTDHGRLYLSMEYSAPVGQRYSHHIGSFGKVILDDISLSLPCVTKAFGIPDVLSTHAQCRVRMTGSMGSTAKHTDIVSNSRTPRFKEVISFEVYERELEVSIEVANCHPGLPSRVIGVARFFVPNHSISEHVVQMLTREGGTRTQDINIESVGTLSFTLMVTYDRHQEFHSCFDPTAYSTLHRQFSSHQEKPKFKLSSMKHSAACLQIDLWEPLQKLHRRQQLLFSWVYPLRSLVMFLIALYVCHQGILFEFLSFLLAAVFPAGYIYFRPWSSGARKSSRAYSLAHQKQMQEYIAYFTSVGSVRRQAKVSNLRKEHEERREELVGGVAGAGQPDKKRAIDEVLEALNVAETNLGALGWQHSKDKADEEEGLMASMASYTWFMYWMSCQADEIARLLRWQNPSATIRLAYGMTGFAISTLVIPCHVFTTLAVIYCFTAHGLYIRYPLLWARFPPWVVVRIVINACLRLVGTNVNRIQRTYLAVNVRLVEGEGLAAKDLTGKSDPYCTVCHAKSGVRFQTPVRKNTVDPQWNTSMPTIYCSRPGDVLLIEVWDWDAATLLSDKQVRGLRFGHSHDFLGQTSLPIWTQHREIDLWVPLRPRPGSKEYVTGAIRLQYSCTLITREEYKKGKRETSLQGTTARNKRKCHSNTSHNILARPVMATYDALRFLVGLSPGFSPQLPIKGIFALPLKSVDSAKKAVSQLGKRSDSGVTTTIGVTTV